jgi:glycosyltransferase involved in cell wall biosynthesis
MPLAVETERTLGEDDLSRVRAKYNLPGKYLLALGANEPRKNVRLLLRAFEMLPKKLQAEYKIVIVGEAWRWREPKELKKPYTRLLGFVDDADLPALYALASAFVFPSRYEGFGLPILEAFLYGTPVISSSGSSLPEVAGDAVLYIDPNDSQTLTDALSRLLGNEKLREQLIAKGSRQLRKFSWAKTARILHKVLMG